MPRTPAISTPILTVNGLLAVGIAMTALCGAIGALAYVRHSGQLASEVAMQTTISQAYQRRAVDCLDLARGWIGDPDQRGRASMSLDLSRGLTLCLVRARNDARINISMLEACVLEVETANTVFEITPGSGILLHPAC